MRPISNRKQPIMEVVNWDTSEHPDFLMSVWEEGRISITYDYLCEIFGDPTITNADPYEKINGAWIIEQGEIWPDDPNADPHEKINVAWIIEVELTTGDIVKSSVCNHRPFDPEDRLIAMVMKSECIIGQRMKLLPK
jgi:hypothetical protein|tara:strand:+ start:34 stop:444 length:411 start_codon:yes stop_codon:yes gene_type:complete